MLASVFVIQCCPGPSANNRTNDPPPKRSDSLPPEDDEAGLDDPYLNDFFPGTESDEHATDEGSVPNVPIGLPADPRDIASSDGDELGPDRAEGFAFVDEASPQGNDDDQGPNAQFSWGDFDALSPLENDEPDDGPIEGQAASLEALQPLERDEPHDEEPISAQWAPLQIDDVDLPWSKERWIELPLHAAISPRRCLALVGTTLCVGGEATHLLNARHFNAIEDAPTSATIERIVCLDLEPRRIILLSTAGQLMLWRRQARGISPIVRISTPNGEVVSMIWQLAPGVPSFLARLESGRLLAWNDQEEMLVPAASLPDRSRLRAISELGEPRVTLYQGAGESYVCVEAGEQQRRLRLTPLMDRAVAESQPVLAGYVDHVLLGVRDHGLFLSGPESPAFSLVPGCRRLTACSVGSVQDRPTAFVALFSELEDRTELVTIDLTNGRALRVAELSIIADDAGPEDDPPERARVDALVWDPSHVRLWAAGCFGLACFAPPGTPVAS